MKLYHGSNIVIDRIDLSKCKPYKDFGQGFYLTEIKEQAEQMIRDSDWICDPLAKRDFCRTIGITEEEFDQTADKFANQEILQKDANGHWRRKDLI